MFNRPWPPLMHVLVLCNRLALGCYLLLAGWSKVSAEINQGMGTYLHSEGFRANLIQSLPDVAVTCYGYGLPWAELAVGGLLMAGLAGRVVAAMVALLVGIAGVSAFAAGENLLQQPAPVLFTLAITLTVLGAGRYSLDAILLNLRQINRKLNSGLATPSKA